MITRWFVVVVACYNLILIQTMLPNVIALRKVSDDDEYMIENKRTHTRQNYEVQRGLDDEILQNMENIGSVHDTDLETENNAEELPALIVDYANMIRNDIFLLDKSVQTRTRKRGNVKKYNHAEVETQCSCSTIKQVIDLGPNTFPPYLESSNCSDRSCQAPYRCKESHYLVTVLTRRTDASQVSATALPYQLKDWFARKVQITTGCTCVGDTIHESKDVF